MRRTHWGSAGGSVGLVMPRAGSDIRKDVLGTWQCTTWDNVRHFVATHRSQIATVAAVASLAIPVVGEAVGASALAISSASAVADVAAVSSGSAAAVGDGRRGNWTAAALDIGGVASVGLARGLRAYSGLEEGRAAANYANPASSILKQDAALNSGLSSQVGLIGNISSIGLFGISYLNQN